MAGSFVLCVQPLGIVHLRSPTMPGVTSVSRAPMVLHRLLPRKTVAHALFEISVRPDLGHHGLPSAATDLPYRKAGLLARQRSFVAAAAIS